MRALFLTHAYPRYPDDPVGSFVLRLAAALRDRGHEIHVLAPSAPKLLRSECYEGIPVERFRYAPQPWETLAYAGNMNTQVRQSWRGRVAMSGFLSMELASAWRIARRERIELVHAHWWFPGGLVGAALHTFRGLPLVTTLHGSDVRLARSLPGGPALFRQIGRASDALTTVSSWLASEVRELAPSIAPIVAPMPVLSELFHPGGARLPDRLLFIGKLTEQKGLHHLLHALSHMNARPTLDVVGAGRVPDEHVRHLADDLGLSDRINWLPLLTQSELAELYRRATIHVIPAVEEGLGLTAVESLLSETPVVAFASGGVPDIVIDGQTGLLVSPGDQRALARAIDRLLAAPSERRFLGRQGREYVVSHFGADAVGDRYSEIYRYALDRHGRVERRHDPGA